MKKIILMTASLLISWGAMAQKSCTIKGRVIDRPQSKEIWVAPTNTDFRVVKPTIVRVNEDGSFTHTLPFESSVVYEITFKDEFIRGRWRPIEFMLEDGTIEFELNAEDKFEENKVEGGKLNNQFAYNSNGIADKYHSEIEALLTKLNDELGENAFSEEYKMCRDSLSIEGLSQESKTLIFRRLNQLSSDNRKYNDEGNTIAQKLDEISQAIKTETLDIVRREPNEASLATLYSYVRRNRYQPDAEDSKLYSKLFNRYYAKRFAENPMAIEISGILNSMNVKVGSRFVDFEAPSLDGRTYKLSDLIKGKVAVLDLWASWCGPCMRTSQSFMPVWERYHEKGFEIIGVARERDNTKAMEAAIKRLGFEWINLIELNDRAKIWNKYGAGNAGGKVILIDRNGKIVAMDFTATELERHLETLIPNIDK